MSRSIHPCVTLPITGALITLPFPDLAKPVPGGWMLELSLRKTNPADGDAFITVLQAGHVVASQLVSLTTSFTDVTMSVSEDDLNKVMTGLCHVSGLVVTITGSTAVVCCDGVSIPTVLNGTWGAYFGDHCNCGGGGASTTFVYDEATGVWASTPAEFCGKSYSGELRCVSGLWECWLTSGCNAGMPITVALRGGPLSAIDCDPFHAKFIWLDSLIASVDDPDQWCCEPATVPAIPDSLTVTITA